MKIIREKVLDSLTFTLSSEEMKHAQMNIIEAIVEKAMSTLLSNEEWVSWIMEQMKTTEVVKGIQGKVSAALTEKITKDLLK